MKNDLLELLACPRCSHEMLDLKIFVREKEETITGELECSACNEIYPIREGIPRMIPGIGKSGRENSDNSIGNVDHTHYEVRNANLLFYDAIAEVYDNEKETEYREGHLVQERIEQMVKGLAEKTEREMFLDLGCGTGNVLKFGKKYFRKSVGIDISFNTLKQARRKGLEAVQADTLFLPFKSSLFDAVSVFSVLHHIYDYDLVFNQIGRVLKNGGYLYSDWDPAKKPSPVGKSIPWGVYRLTNDLCLKLRRAKGGLKAIIKNGVPESNSVDFLSLRPDLKDINAKAEFHNKTRTEERGIDFGKIKNQLRIQGFCDIRAFYHEGGLTLDQLTGIPLFRSKLLTILGLDPEPFLENIMIQAKKNEGVFNSTKVPVYGITG